MSIPEGVNRLDACSQESEGALLSIMEDDQTVPKSLPFLFLDMLFLP